MASTKVELQREVKGLRRRVAELEAAREEAPPPLPPADGNGYRPAVETMTVVLAHKLIARRRAAGLSQAELARRAGVRLETICRIERARNSPNVRTMDKIDRALTAAGVASVPMKIEGGTVVPAAPAAAGKGKTRKRRA